MTIQEKVLGGIPLTDEVMIDCHTHMGPWHNFNAPENSAAEMVASMDRVGVRCCFSSSHSSIGPDFRYGNDMILQAIADFPGRIHGYCTVNPNYPEKEMVDELERCCVNGPMRAIKFHPDLHLYRVEGSGYRAAWEFANERGMILLSHTWLGSGFSNLDTFDLLAERYPNVTILLGHSGAGYGGFAKSAELAKKHPKVYMDLTGSICLFRQLERAVEAVGSEKILFGTDLPFIDLRPGLGRVAFSRITEEDKRKILGLNMARIAGLDL